MNKCTHTHADFVSLAGWCVCGLPEIIPGESESCLIPLVGWPTIHPSGLHPVCVCVCECIRAPSECMACVKLSWGREELGTLQATLSRQWFFSVSVLRWPQIPLADCFLDQNAKRVTPHKAQMTKGEHGGWVRFGLASDWAGERCIDDHTVILKTSNSLQDKEGGKMV